MKILMTASSFAHIRSFHLPYIEGLHELGHTVDVACGGELWDIPFADRLIALPMEKRMFSLKNLKSSGIIRKAVKENGYDRVIMHTSLAAFWTRLALIGLKEHPYTINVVHGYLFDDRTDKLKAALLKGAEYICAPVTDKVLTMNAWDYAWAKEHSTAKTVEYIPGMGADEEKVKFADKHDYDFEENAFVLIYPAEFSKRKNQSFLIRAMAKLPENVKLLLPGHGELLESCKALVEALGLSGRVLFPGYLEDIIPWIKGADVAVSSSLSEGLPFNIIEAMQCGLPVIVSRIKGNTEPVMDGENGFTYESTEEFIYCVKKLLTEDTLRNFMSKSSIEFSKRYSLGMVYPKVIEEYIRS